MRVLSVVLAFDRPLLAVRVLTGSYTFLCAESQVLYKVPGSSYSYYNLNHLTPQPQLYYVRTVISICSQIYWVPKDSGALVKIY